MKFSTLVIHSYSVKLPYFKASGEMKKKKKFEIAGVGSNQWCLTERQIGEIILS